MEKEKFHFEIVEGEKGKKEKKEEISDLASEALDFMVAYKNYIEKFSKDNEILKKYSNEIDQLVIFLKAELSKNKVEVKNIENIEYSEDTMSVLQIDTNVDWFWERLRRLSDVGEYVSIIESLERFMKIRKYANQEILQITSNPDDPAY